MICWLHKKVISRSLDANAELPTGTLQHLGHCAACAGFYEAQARIVRELIAGADEHQKSPSPFLHTRIMATIRREQSVTTRRTIRSRTPWTVAAAACVLLGVFLGLQNQSPNNSRIALSQPDSAGATIELTTMLNLAKRPDLRELSLKVNLPLETELQLVVNDAKAAVNYLADSFLPDELRRAALNDGRP